MDIVERAELAGVSSTPDRRPLSTRLTCRATRVIANGIDAEPVVAAERAVLLRYPEQVFRGLSLALEATGASEGFLALRAADTELLSTVARVGARFAHVRLIPVEDYYPAGDTASLILEAAGFQLAPGVAPEDSGVMVLSAHTLYLLYEAVRGRPMTHRFVTVAGEVADARTMRVPIGTSVGELLKLCGGSTIEEAALVLGGPVGGKVVDPDTPVDALSSALLVLSQEHPVVQRAEMSLETALRRAASACASCRMCTDRCPQHLMGYAIHPHLLMRGLTYHLDSVPEVVTGAGSCTACHLCEAVCPANLAPGRLYQAVKEDLRSKGLIRLPQMPPQEPRESRSNRRVPLDWLEKRLGMTSYTRPLPVDDNYYAVERVFLDVESLEPVVSIGEEVSLGQLVAKHATSGARVHSSIAGRVARVDSRTMEILGK